MVQERPFLGDFWEMVGLCQRDIVYQAGLRLPEEAGFTMYRTIQHVVGVIPLFLLRESFFHLYQVAGPLNA